MNLLQELEPDAEISEWLKDYTYTISIQTMEVKFNKVGGILHLVNFFYNSSNTTDVVRLALFYIRYRLNSNLYSINFKIKNCKNIDNTEQMF